MQPGGTRENFPEQLILSFLLKSKVKDRPARETEMFSCLEAKALCRWLIWLEQRVKDTGQWELKMSLKKFIFRMT